MLQFKTIKAVFGKGVDCVAQDQTHVLGIAPYEGMKLAMEREAEAFPDLHLDVRTGDLEAGAGIVQELPAGIYDCIISRRYSPADPPDNRYSCGRNPTFCL